MSSKLENENVVELHSSEKNITTKWYKDNMTVKHPDVLPPKIECERKQLGGNGAYKPNVIKFSDGELLLANFHMHYEQQEDGSVTEHIMLYRSVDNGLSWEARHFDHLWGREPYLNVFRDGTLLMTTHHLAEDVRNRLGRGMAVLHRSEDRGHAWKSTIIDKNSIPDKGTFGPNFVSSRNIIEIEGDVLLMGICGGFGNDYVFKSFDRGKTWKPFPSVIYGYDRDKYLYSAFEEAVFWISGKNRLFMLSRCSPEFMVFTEKINGMPDFDFKSATGSDHFEVEILYESKDNGLSWYPLKALNLVCVMYPSVTALENGRTLLTFTVREPIDGNHMGVQAIIVDEDDKGVPDFNLNSDRVIIDEKTPDYLQSGGGFGNTIRLNDNKLLTVYSYYDADEDIKKEMEDGSYFADEEKFEKVRNKAAEFSIWAKGFNFNALKDKNDRLRRHCYLGCCEVLRKAFVKTEITLWQVHLL